MQQGRRDVAVVFLLLCCLLLVSGCRSRLSPSDVQPTINPTDEHDGEGLTLTSHCGLHGTAVAWLDENRNGVREESELPVVGIPFYVEHERDPRHSPGLIGVSDAHGRASVNLRLTDCWLSGYQLVVDPIAPYELTTPGRLAVTGGEKSYAFGFAPIPDAVSLVPPAHPLSCVTLSGRGGEMEKVAPDGTLWWTSGSFGPESSDVGYQRPDAEASTEASDVEGYGILEIPPDTRYINFLGLDVAEEGVVWLAFHRFAGPDPGVGDGPWEEAGLARWDGEWRLFPFSDRADWDVFPLDVLIVNEREVWTVTNHEVLSLDPVTGAWRTRSDPTAFPDTTLGKMFLAEDGSVWLIFDSMIYHTVPGGVVEERPTWTAVSLTEESDGAPFTWIADAELVAGRYLWMVGPTHDARYALARLDVQEGEWLVHTYASTNGGLAPDAMWEVAVGADESVWVGFPGNQIGRYLPLEDAWLRYYVHGLPRNVMPTLTAAPDGRLWISGRLCEVP